MMEQLVSGLSDVEPDVFTWTSRIVNVISSPTPTWLLRMALVFYRGQPRAISHVYSMCEQVVCVCVCGGVERMSLGPLTINCLCGSVEDQTLSCAWIQSVNIKAKHI